MEVVDELMTPGCPQCAIKHLSAALYYQAREHAEDLRHGFRPRSPTEDRVLLARAFINLGEVLIGYRSHLWFAVGLLQRSEEVGLCLGSCTNSARSARLAIEARGLDGVRAAMQTIYDGVLFDPAAMMHAHIDEARRELPRGSLDFDCSDIPATIERVREEYFSLPEVTVAEGEKTTKEKEPTMATAKKKAPAKAAKAAKCAKCACKGGKTKKGK